MFRFCIPATMSSSMLVRVVLFAIQFQVRRVAAVLPILTEDENPNNKPWIYLSPSRVSGDVLIPYGINLNDGVRYYVDWKKQIEPSLLKTSTRGVSSPDAATILNRNTNCKTLFSPGRLYYRAYAFKGPDIGRLSLDDSVHRYLDLKPARSSSSISTQADLNRIRTCCSPSPPCTERCFAVPELQYATFAITAPDEKTILMSGRCTYCALESCVSQCSEGEFVTAYGNLDAVIHPTSF